jgi:hypothetical protein
MHKKSLSASILDAPKVVTLRGIDPGLRSALDAEAERLGVSLNSMILQILRRSLALDSDAPLAHDLDGLAGSWSKQEAEEFAAAVKGFEELDPSLWQDAPDAP